MPCIRLWARGPASLAFLCLFVSAGATDSELRQTQALRANVEWLSADARAGRLTPSPGLDASADYLAGQFRLAGLAAGGDSGSYFQNASFARVARTPAGFRLTLESAGRRVDVRAANAEIRWPAALDFGNVDVLVLPESGALPDVAGKVVAGGESYDVPAVLRALEARKPALILLLTATPADPPQVRAPVLTESDPSVPPVIRVASRAAAGLRAARGGMKLTLHLPAPVRHDLMLRNVAGILRGTDATLRDQYVIVSAHYDHLGVRPPGPGNRVYHGANDDASGSASLIEIARSLSVAGHRPRRSVLFLAFFGEEEGLVGSGYYVRHPLVPLDRTVADINLEQLGRTDSSDGPEVSTFAFTGPSFSDLPRTMAAAAKPTGVSVYRKDTADDYFDRSDNYSFALAGIVAHTLVVAFEFRDYHEVGDEAAKLDYPNLARVDRAIAAGVEAVADAAQKPKWSDTKAYNAQEWQSRH